MTFAIGYSEIIKALPSTSLLNNKTCQNRFIFIAGCPFLAESGHLELTPISTLAGSLYNEFSNSLEYVERV